MKVYHGTKEAKLVPTYKYKGASKNLDFGDGFYTTPNLELAKE
jgi:hypothetical protein